MDKLASSLQLAEPGNWLHRLLLLDHIECVHKKMLNWIEDVDRKIDGKKKHTSKKYVSGFEKRGHFAHVIFERTPVFKWLLVGQILLKLNGILKI